MAEILFELIFSGLILALALGAALAITRVVSRILLGYARRTATGLDDKVLPVVIKPLGIAIFLAGLQASLVRLEFLQSIPSLVDGLTLLFQTLWALLAALIAYKLVSILLGHFAAVKREAYPGLASTIRPIGSVIRLLIIVSFLFTLLNIAGVDISPFIFGWGLLGFAIVLALQPVLQDLITGFYVSIAQPYKVGDSVQLPTGEVCEIRDIKAQQAVLYNLVDLSYIRIPNTELLKTKVVSPGESGLTLVIPFKLTIDSDIELAKTLAEEIVSAMPGISKEPQPAVYLSQLDGAAVNFEVVCWIKNPAERRKILDQINTKIMRNFKEKGLRFPA